MTDFPMDSRAAEIRKVAQSLFAEGKIELFLGFEQGSLPLRSRPCFAHADGTDRLVWDSFCANNLAAFLPKYYENLPGRPKKRDKPYPRIGIAAKACDLRSIVALVKEKQVRRESLVVVGVPCRGMIDTRKVEAAVAAAAGQVVGHEELDNGTLTVTLRGGKKLSFEREKVLQDCCLECRYPMPEGADVMIAGEARKPGDGGYARVRAFEAKSPEERWEHFHSELSRCIRCNACRQACPTCWCKECFAEHTNLRWIGAGTEASDKMFFSIIRIFHQAGRCVECDACYRACPMGIDLRLYTKKIVKDVEEAFGYLPAFDEKELPPLATFGEKDGDSFITDPDKPEPAQKG
jgi:formate dehydrogenase subunit beta